MHHLSNPGVRSPRNYIWGYIYISVIKVPSPLWKKYANITMHMHCVNCVNIYLLTLGAHAQRGLQYSVCLSVCLSVTTLQASVVDRTLKFRHQREQTILSSVLIRGFC